MPSTRQNSTKGCLAPTISCDIVCCECDDTITYHGGCFRRHVELKHNLTLDVYYLKHIEPNANICLCGCGNTTKWINHAGGRFVDFSHGHNLKNKTIETSPIVRQRSLSIKKSWDENRHGGGFRDQIVVAKSAIARSKTMKRLYSEGNLTLPNMKITSEGRTLSAQKAYQTRLNASTLPCGGWPKIKRGWYTSSKNKCDVYYQSDWERMFMETLDTNDEILHWQRCKEWIGYFDKFSNKRRRYYPDFITTDVQGNKTLIEVKGQVTDLDLIKIQAGCVYASTSGLNFKVMSLDNKTKTFIEANL